MEHTESYYADTVMSSMLAEKMIDLEYWNNKLSHPVYWDTKDFNPTKDMFPFYTIRQIPSKIAEEYILVFFSLDELKKRHNLDQIGIATFEKGLMYYRVIEVIL